METRRRLCWPGPIVTLLLGSTAALIIEATQWRGSFSWRLLPQAACSAAWPVGSS